jgi:hypothetical protein
MRVEDSAHEEPLSRNLTDNSRERNELHRGDPASAFTSNLTRHCKAFVGTNPTGDFRVARDPGNNPKRHSCRVRTR